MSRPDLGPVGQLAKATSPRESRLVRSRTDNAMRNRASRAATIALFATAVGFAAPTNLMAQDVACDQGDREVRALEFRGNRALSDDDLSIRVSTTASDRRRRILRIFGTRRCLGPNQLARDVILLRRYYHDRGFYRVRVDTTVQALQ